MSAGQGRSPFHESAWQKSALDRLPTLGCRTSRVMLTLLAEVHAPFCAGKSDDRSSRLSISHAWHGCARAVREKRREGPNLQGRLYLYYGQMQHRHLHLLL